MHNKRIIRRPSFGRIYFFRGIRIQRISSQAINRFRGERHQTARFQDIPCPPYLLLVRMISFYNCIYCIHRTAFLPLSMREILVCSADMISYLLRRHALRGISAPGFLRLTQKPDAQV